MEVGSCKKAKEVGTAVDIAAQVVVEIDLDIVDDSFGEKGRMAEELENFAKATEAALALVSEVVQAPFENYLD